MFACLERANASGYSSIAFPALGTGYHKFPVDAAAESMVAAIVKFSSQRSQQTITDVRIVLYGGSDNLTTLEKVRRTCTLLNHLSIEQEVHGPHRSPEKPVQINKHI